MLAERGSFGRLCTEERASGVQEKIQEGLGSEHQISKFSVFMCMFKCAQVHVYAHVCVHIGKSWLSSSEAIYHGSFVLQQGLHWLAFTKEMGLAGQLAQSCTL